ncbi:MAG: MFS transporter, partial [Bacteroidaceae bacterium]|nr:MFS transporter [Bacteroidaceae bacterium]
MGKEITTKTDQKDLVSSQTTAEVFKRSPLQWVPTLYFAMGVPFVVLNMVCSLMFKGLQVSDTQIAFWTSLIMLPWTLKPLWSPFLEIYKTKKFFVVLTQISCGVVFGLVGVALHLPSFFAISIALLAVIAICGATHDIAADGVYMQELNNEQQAQWIGWQGAFYNIAKIFATGVLVYFAGVLIKTFSGSENPTMEGTKMAWMSIMLIVGTVMLLLGIYHFFRLPAGRPALEQKKTFADVARESLSIFADFFRKKHIVYYIFFIILYRFAEGFVMKIVPLFLKAPVA